MTTVTLPTKLTIAEASATLAQLQQALAVAGEAPVVNAAPLQVLDTSAVAVLLECERSVQQRGTRLLVQGAPVKLVALARLYGVDGLLGLQDASAGA